MTYRQTLVIEYPDSSSAPRVDPMLPILGGTLHAVQFSDAIAEIELWREHATEDTIRKVDAILIERWRAGQ